MRCKWAFLHVVLEFLQMITLFGDFLPQLQELLILTLADGVILIGLFAFGKGISGETFVSSVAANMNRSLPFPLRNSISRG